MSKFIDLVLFNRSTARVAVQRDDILSVDMAEYNKPATPQFNFEVIVLFRTNTRRPSMLFATKGRALAAYQRQLAQLNAD